MLSTCGCLSLFLPLLVSYLPSTPTPTPTDELDGVVGGCVAIVPDGSGAYELSKMAVSPALRGHGAGRALLGAAVRRARELGASSLFLGSSTKLAPAVHLYEAVGFRHVPRESLHMPYARASVFMRMDLAPTG